MNLQIRRFLLLLLAALLLSALGLGCAVGGGDNDDEDADVTTGEGVFRLTATTDARGTATVSFGLPDGTTKFSITASIDDDDLFIRFIDLVSGAGTDYLSPSGRQLSFADTFSSFINVASVPSRDDDPGIVNGERYTAVIELEDDFGTAVEGETIDFEVVSKIDPGLDGGRMRVNVYFVGDVGQDQVTKSTVRAAFDTFRSIYQNAAGVSLDISEFDIDGPVVLPLPVLGDDFYRSASGRGPNPAVNIFIGGDVDAGGISGEVLGVAGGIPAPPNPSERSGLAVSIFAAAGPDGIFSAEDVRLLGETMAHETGHYAGLFHPVDFAGSSVTNTDPLDDTDSCGFLTECIANGSLAANLMFASPVADGNGSFIAQNQLSQDQRSVINRYIVTD